MPSPPNSAAPVQRQGNAHLAFAHSKKKRRWRLKFLALSVALLCALMLSRSPLVPESAPPTSGDVRTARNLFDQITLSSNVPGRHPFDIGWSEIRTVTQLSGRAAGLRRVSLEKLGNSAHVVSSVPLGLGFWGNVHLFIESDAVGTPRISGKVGRVPIPSFLAHGAIGLTRFVLEARGANVPPLDEMIAGLRISDQGVHAKLDLPAQTKLFAALGGLRSDGINKEQVALTYCRLVAEQKAAQSSDFAEHVRRAFAGGSGNVVDNRSRFVALAMVTASTKLGQLAGGTQAIVARCGAIGGGIMLLGREDLAKHWAVSAALTATFGEDASIAVGTWKEISDSGQGGTGFSLIDLAADRAGIFAARRASDDSLAMAQQQKLANAREADILPISAIAEREGMSEAEFKARYTSTDSAAYAESVRRIDATLAGLR
jgi:hypothetical protein